MRVWHSKHQICISKGNDATGGSSVATANVPKLNLEPCDNVSAKGAAPVRFVVNKK